MCCHVSQVADQNNDLLIGALLNAAAPAVDVHQHWREGGKIKRHIVMQCPARSDRYRMPGTLADQLRVADIDPVFRLHQTVAAVQPVIQNPRDIVPMDDTPDQSFLRVEAGAVIISHVLSLLY